MQRYTSDDKPSMYKADDGEFYLVEDIDSIIADRDIKAANLQTLVGLVLAYKHPGAGPDATLPKIILTW